jgi:hypothetical protein
VCGLKTPSFMSKCVNNPDSSVGIIYTLTTAMGKFDKQKRPGAFPLPAFFAVLGDWPS